VWLAHTVADAGGIDSRARYARISVSALAALEDEAFGSSGCWYFYPAIAVDDGDNLAMVFGRSCTDEYAGIGLTARSTADAALEPSVRVKDGVASYVVPIGNTELVTPTSILVGFVQSGEVHVRSFTGRILAHPQRSHPRTGHVLPRRSCMRARSH